ncbi:ROK family protein [Coprothermobacteraceae bacterium]|nr:ROK family protein [Coprothermobacteraceae bacterium]
MRVLAVDIGGTKIDVAWVEDGKILKHHRVSTVAPEQIIKVLADCAKEGNVSAIGVGVAGQVDYETGAVLFAPNLGWRSFPLGTLLQQETGVPVFVENDANVFALGTWFYEFDRKPNSLLGITLGTGVGGGFVYHGELLRSPFGATMEVGHMVVKSDGPTCTCGSQGCLEAFSGGWALERWYAEKSGTKITGKDIYRRALEGEELAVKAFKRLGYYLGIGTASLVNILNPELIVLGGSISTTWDLWKDTYAAEFSKHALPPLKGIPTVISRLKESALFGAAALVYQSITL